jgi:hypothetical protein
MLREPVCRARIVRSIAGRDRIVGGANGLHATRYTLPAMALSPSSPTRPRLAPFTHTHRSIPQPSALYPILWRFAAERQLIYMRRVAGLSGPWTTDEVIRRYRFTNAYRASDRTSQYLIHMTYAQPQLKPATSLLRTLLFKFFNKIETWESIISRCGEPSAETFDFRACERALFDLRQQQIPIYSAAYIMPTFGKSGGIKHVQHLHLLQKMLKDELPEKLAASDSLERAYHLLVAYPSIGPFLGFQYAIDLNYTPLINHSESDFVVAGPGALDGLSKIFDSLNDYSPADAIRLLTDRQEKEFDRLNLTFPTLWGRRLQPIDVQNLLCEVSKYTRSTHPTVRGLAGRIRLKRLFTAKGHLEIPFFPPKWELNACVRSWLRHPDIPTYGSAV